MMASSWQRNTNSSSTTCESVFEQNATFALNIVREASGEKVDVAKDCIYKTLSSCVEQVLANCESQIRQLVNQLDLSRGVGCDKFTSLADELFEADKGYIIHWERIVTLFAFTWVLSKALQSHSSESSSNISKMLASYLNDKIAPWIQQNGGWIKICDEFGTDSSSSNKWKYFLLTGLGIGLVATYKLTH